MRAAEIDEEEGRERDPNAADPRSSFTEEKRNHAARETDVREQKRKINDSALNLKSSGGKERELGLFLTEEAFFSWTGS